MIVNKQVMTYIQKTQIRFAVLYMRIKASETQEELARLRKVIGWLKYRNMSKASDLTFAYYEVLRSNISKRVLALGLSQNVKNIVVAHKNIVQN